MKQLLLVCATLAAALVATLYFWNSSWHEINDLKLELAERTAEVKKQTQELANRDSEIDSLKNQLADLQARADRQQATTSDSLQALEAKLAAERAVAEEKKKQYQDLLANPNADPDTAAKIKATQDEIAALEQREHALDQEIANTSDDAQAARQNHAGDAGYQIAQAKNRVQAAQDTLHSLQAQRNSLPNGQSAQRQQLNAQIAAANQDLSAARADLAQTQRVQRGQGHVLEQNIKGSLREAKSERADNHRTLEAKRQALAALKQQTSTSGQVQRARNDLLKKLYAELKDESEKLKNLEAQVAREKLKAQSGMTGAAP